MLRASIVAGALLWAGQAGAAPAAPLVIPAGPVAHAVYHQCAPGAHWYSHKVWRNGKKVRVGHCVPNAR